jgi:tetratricopeptide (TPR) repeat protein
MLSELHDEEAAKEALLGRALDILDRPQSSSFELGVALSEMGRLRHEQGRLQEALQLCERALQTQQRALGSAEHRELAYPLVRLSRVLMDLERPRDALPLLERALAVQRETPFDPIATEARFELGKALLTIDPASGRGQTLAREAVAAFRDENSGYAAEAEQWLRDHGIAIDRAP